MRKILSAIFILVLFITMSYAQTEVEEKVDTEQTSLPQAKAVVSHHIIPPKFVSGEVVNIDTSNPEVTFLTLRSVNGEEMLVEVDPNLSITKIISPAELESGDKIRITYEEKGTKKVTRNIFLGRPHPIREETTP